MKSRKRDRADDAVSAVRKVAVEHLWAVFDLVGETTSRFGGPTVVFGDVAGAIDDRLHLRGPRPTLPAVIPLGETWIVLSNGGDRKAAFAIHGATAPALIVAVVLLSV
ncbi:DUF4267 domain-containing protein [Rhodococcus wratislaviensis]|uniref:Uncharacterized protein n=1 Tax=Rhodococcus wratislaviensis NBRC 100605 TaxID=1219028 RepID=X0QCG2_RHOWR|nr:DUF4267 domain-containing protein [Rhodococcus wratislaviensis]GAF48581.1 hypothetical protein RW1_056_00070 [Rhodococcus wratislaviensis NBRC 100605]